MTPMKYKVKPDSSACRCCLETQESYGVIENCSKCLVEEDAVFLDMRNFMGGRYAIIFAGGEIKTVPHYILEGGMSEINN